MIKTITHILDLATSEVKNGGGIFSDKDIKDLSKVLIQLEDLLDALKYKERVR